MIKKSSRFRLHIGTQKLKSLVTHRLENVASSGSMRAIREGLLWLIPCILISAIFLFLSSLLQLAGLPPNIVQLLSELHADLSNLLPLMAAASIGYMLAIQHRLPRLPIAFLCLFHLQLAAFLLETSPNTASPAILFTAIISPIINVPIMARLYSPRWMHIGSRSFIGVNVQEAMSLFVAGLASALLITTTIVLLKQIPGLIDFQLPLSLISPDTPYSSGVFITALNSLLWFFGIHGYYALKPIILLMDQPILINAENIAVGLDPQYALNTSLLGTLVFIGGSGGSLSLGLAILLFCRGKGLRLLALAGVPMMALLNVNEILLFGLPIILNLRLILPFFIVPILNLILSLTAIQIGWVTAASVMMPFNSPILLNAYLSTGGDWRAVILQTLLIALGILVYTPFIRALDQSGARREAIYFHSLDTTFSRLPEEANLLSRDLIEQTYHSQIQREQTLHHIREISKYTFYLEFQPQVSQLSGLCTGCEALLRARNHKGEIQSPGNFLRWLREADLMREVDLWVADRAITQSQIWSEEGLLLPISINITGNTLVSPEYCEKLIHTLSKAHGLVGIEITEDEIVSDIPSIQNAIERIRKIGATVSIDDFGTGYSSISYLHLFDVDAIKIDRSFVVAQEHPKGALVLEGLLRFCTALRIPIVIEGVETQAQYEVFDTSTAVTIQGWYFSRSIEGEKVPKFVQERYAAVEKAAPA